VLVLVRRSQMQEHKCTWHATANSHASANVLTTPHNYPATAQHERVILPYLLPRLFRIIHAQSCIHNGGPRICHSETATLRTERRTRARRTTDKRVASKCFAGGQVGPSREVGERRTPPLVTPEHSVRGHVPVPRAAGLVLLFLLLLPWVQLV